MFTSVPPNHAYPTNLPAEGQLLKFNPRRTLLKHVVNKHQIQFVVYEKPICLVVLNFRDKIDRFSGR